MSQIESVVRGLLGAAAGTACMSVLRMGARRAGLIDLTPPQATKNRLAAWTGRKPATVAGHHLSDAAVHLAVGLGGGAVYGAAVAARSRPGLLGGLLFGAGLWVVAFGVVIPWLGISRSPRRSTATENLVNLAAHLLYGLSTALVAGELAEQAHGPGGAARRWRGRVG
jgi:uncharacterized membrane protein YagU involved in acid resistance